jgi:hypothetical protein
LVCSQHQNKIEYDGRGILDIDRCAVETKSGVGESQGEDVKTMGRVFASASSGKPPVQSHDAL